MDAIDVQVTNKLTKWYPEVKKLENVGSQIFFDINTDGKKVSTCFILF